MTDRYPGPRWEMAYGSRDGVERCAVDQLHRAVSRFLPYVVRLAPAAGASAPQEGHRIVVGTPESSPLVAELCRTGTLKLPAEPESYAVTCAASPWNSERRLLAVAGADPKGVLNGVMALDAMLSSRQGLEGLGDLSLSDHPRVANRGIWCWGYTVYDYRRFLDNMARLRMNMLTLWNDIPPVNCAEVIEYAHSRGVKVVLGFAWGWGKKYDLASAAERGRLRDDVVREYDQHYQGLPHDGIYFQTLTEHHNTSVGGVTVASIVCGLVNETAGALLDRHPGLHIQFGLHATSILDNCTDLAGLDPRVAIVWEDAGVIPYSYSPVPDTTTEGENFATALDTPEKTLAYSRTIAALRPGTPFGLVPKGWMTLDWKNEFENHGAFILGERSPEFIRERLAKRQPRWDRVNALWEQHYRHAVTFYREMLAVNPTGMIAAGLVEDGLFEEKIQPSVALLGEMLWDPTREPEQILAAAQSRFYG